MKRLILILVGALSFLSAFAQEEKSPFFFNEFTISLNKTLPWDDNTESRYGFGVGITRVMREQKKMNFVFGFEYNLTQQLKKTTYEGRYAHATDVEYTLNNLSVPLNIRLNFGTNTRFFVEAGAFADLILSSKRKGKKYIEIVEGHTVISSKVADFKGKGNLSHINYGVAGGIGVSVPFDKFELIIKPDVRLGLHELDSFSTSFLNSYIRLNIGIKTI